MEPLAVLLTRQPELFGGAGPLRTTLIARQADFDELFEGFCRLRAVSYAVSPETLLALFDRGFERIEVIVGERLGDDSCFRLGGKGARATRRLSARVADGRLRLLLPDTPIHTKLYLLDGPGLVRVVQTSANLTETARGAASPTRGAAPQVNYAWYIDLEADHPFAYQAAQDYAAHARRCALFRGDLTELIRCRRESLRRESVEAWLWSAGARRSRGVRRGLFQELARRLWRGLLLWLT